MNIDKERPVKIFELNDKTPNYVNFYPEIEIIFVTGGLDKKIPITPYF